MDFMVLSLNFNDDNNHSKANFLNAYGDRRFTNIWAGMYKVRPYNQYYDILLLAVAIIVLLVTIQIAIAAAIAIAAVAISLRRRYQNHIDHLLICNTPINKPQYAFW